MAQEEKYGSRDLIYSAWHRRLSLKRFIGIEAAQTCSMIDTDAQTWVECEDKTFRPLMLVETARDIGQPYKNGTLIKNDARRGAPCQEDIPAYIVLYKPSNELNPANADWQDVESFRVRRLWPEPETEWESLSPQEWAERIVKIRKWSARRLDKVLNKQADNPPETKKQWTAAEAIAAGDDVVADYVMGKI